MKRELILPATLLLSAIAWAGDEPEFNQTASKTKSMEIRIESNTALCTAIASLEYLQRGAEAEVVTNVHTDDCAAAGGNYTLKITVRGDSDKEPRTLSFEESWERSDDAPVQTEKRYPIGDDVDLLRIKARELSCRCADPGERSAE